MRIHVVAVAGTGMGALAGLLHELGHEVSGSDVAFDPPMGPALESWGIRCLPGFDPKHLEGAELVVIGNVCRKDNVEAVAAIERGIPYTHIAGALRRFALANSSPLVVAGTHGKTTTSALVAFLLDAAGRAPGFLIGGIPKNFGRSFRPVSSSRSAKTSLPTVSNTGAALPADSPTPGSPLRLPPFVVEGDEYDTAFFEKTAKFLHYGAEVAIITSIEHDHIDIYPTFDSYLEPFRRFVIGIPEHGLVVANAADEHVVAVVSEYAKAPVAWYALEGEPTHGCAPHWFVAPSAGDARAQSFDLYAGGVYAGRLALPLAGRHNLSNAAAAIAAAAQGYGVKLAEIAPALANFQGVRRRQDLIGEPHGVLVYDDFAHHPTAVQKTLAGLRARHPNGRLFAVFEPRSATACRNLHQSEYTVAFDAADRVLLAPLGRSGLPAAEQLDLGRLETELALRGKPTERLTGVEQIVERLVQSAEPGDVIALLSNGSFGGIHQRLVEALEHAANGPIT